MLYLGPTTSHLPLPDTEHYPGEPIRLPGDQRQTQVPYLEEQTVQGRLVGYSHFITHYSYASTSRTVSREAFRAGRKLARALRITTRMSQTTTPAIE